MEFECFLLDIKKRFKEATELGNQLRVVDGRNQAISKCMYRPGDHHVKLLEWGSLILKPRPNSKRMKNLNLQTFIAVPS
ncbi:hypothetical protein CEXT_389871 [Caerostris extrusa]|uniref:Uncharacterized protein n=1 Tax=Caerostris extrusa TaxID=172846 RepID=A0AAV4V9B6_CAEEX|nr:hypothetical protein CEXT_389871 [Caerostris extrusa]